MDRDFLIDLFADFGPVTIRRMFPATAFRRRHQFRGSRWRAGLYFRADETTIPLFEAEGSAAVFVSDQHETWSSFHIGNCRRGCFDDPKKLSDWARAALASARLAALRKRPKGRQAAKKAVAKKPVAKKRPVIKTGRRPKQKKAAKKSPVVILRCEPCGRLHRRVSLEGWARKHRASHPSRLASARTSERTLERSSGDDGKISRYLLRESAAYSGSARR